jgi:hypothetical protein
MPVPAPTHLQLHCKSPSPVDTGEGWGGGWHERLLPIWVRL